MDIKSRFDVGDTVYRAGSLGFPEKKQVEKLWFDTSNNGGQIMYSFVKGGSALEKHLMDEKQARERFLEATLALDKNLFEKPKE